MCILSYIIKWKILYVQIRNRSKKKTDLVLLLLWAVIGRDDRIWTRDILYPKQTRYQAALHPFQWVYSIIVKNPRLVFHILIFLFPLLICKMDLAFSCFLGSYHITYNNNKLVFFLGILRRKAAHFSALRKKKKIKSYLPNHFAFQFELRIPRTNTSGL